MLCCLKICVFCFWKSPPAALKPSRSPAPEKGWQGKPATYRSVDGSVLTSWMLISQAKSPSGSACAAKVALAAASFSLAKLCLNGTPKLRSAKNTTPIPEQPVPTLMAATARAAEGAETGTAEAAKAASTIGSDPCSICPAQMSRPAQPRPVQPIPARPPQPKPAQPRPVLPREAQPTLAQPDVAETTAAEAGATKHRGHGAVEAPENLSNNSSAIQ